jgi:hypothetical protein
MESSGWSQREGRFPSYQLATRDDTGAPMRRGTIEFREPIRRDRHCLDRRAAPRVLGA